MLMPLRWQSECHRLPRPHGFSLLWHRAWLLVHGGEEEAPAGPSNAGRLSKLCLRNLVLAPAFPISTLHPCCVILYDLHLRSSSSRLPGPLVLSRAAPWPAPSLVHWMCCPAGQPIVKWKLTEWTPTCSTSCRHLFSRNFRMFLTGCYWCLCVSLGRKKTIYGLWNNWTLLGPDQLCVAGRHVIKRLKAEQLQIHWRRQSAGGTLTLLAECELDAHVPLVRCVLSWS